MYWKFIRKIFIYVHTSINYRGTPLGFNPILLFSLKISFSARRTRSYSAGRILCPGHPHALFFCLAFCARCKGVGDQSLYVTLANKSIMFRFSLKVVWSPQKNRSILPEWRN